MGERFGESPYDGCEREMAERRIAELTAQRILEKQEEQGYFRNQNSPLPILTMRDLLLNKYRNDVSAMAKSRIFYNVDSKYYMADHRGKPVYYKVYSDAVKGEIDYLESPAVV